MPGSRDLRPRLGEADVLLANIPDPVILVDARMLVQRANAAAHALLPALGIDQPLSYALRDPDILSGINSVLRTGDPLSIAYHRRIPAERTFEVRIGALGETFSGDGQPGAMLFFRDLTAAHRLERMRVDFVANVSHELRTPLASLIGFIETLTRLGGDDPATRTRFLGIMREQALRMSRLIDDLLSLSRIELHAHVAPTTPIDLAPLASHIVDSLQPLALDRGVEIVLEQAASPCTVLGDRDELLRLLENLIENAVKYGERGKRVEVTLGRIPAGGGGAAQVELRVRDYGPGIAPEHLPRLTERFYRVDIAESRAKGGTGLGLAIVKHIVARHRGRLAIESELGQGASFRVLLPEHAEA